MSRRVVMLLVVGAALACNPGGRAEEVKIFILQPERPARSEPTISSPRAEPASQPARDESAVGTGIIVPGGGQSAGLEIRRPTALPDVGVYHFDRMLGLLKLSDEQVRQLVPVLTGVKEQLRQEGVEQREQLTRLQQELQADYQGKYQQLAPRIQELTRALNRARARILVPLAEKVRAVLTDQQARMFTELLDDHPIEDSPVAMARKRARYLMRRYAPLGLSEAQQDRIMDIILRFQRDDERAALSEKLSKAQAAGDARAVAAVQDEIRKAETEQAERTRQMNAEIDAALTGEQRAKFRELYARPG